MSDEATVRLLRAMLREVEETLRERQCEVRAHEAAHEAWPGEYGAVYYCGPNEAEISLKYGSLGQFMRETGVRLHTARMVGAYRMELHFLGSHDQIKAFTEMIREKEKQDDRKKQQLGER